jgi:outer membrane protein, multidrug efflux system
MRRLILIALFVIPMGCTVGPNYQRPTVSIPDSYRQPYSPPSSQSVQSLGDEKWWDVFGDPDLQQLIRTALENNYDVRIAASRVLQARAQLGITRAGQFPSVSAGADIIKQRANSAQLGSVQTANGQVTVSASWDLDFWGKYRRATEEARATVLAYEWAQKEVLSTLVADVAIDYFQLRALDSQLEVSKRTLSARRESLQMTQKLEQAGIDSMTDVREAEQLVYIAAAEVADLERQVTQQEDAISILLGRNPGDVPRGLELTQQPHAPEVPVGLPSSLLERRPDIRQAEESLIAANAQIGVARAAFFPSISLTGDGGFQSSALASLFTGPAKIWSLAASLIQPVFEGGRLRNNLRLAEAEHEQMLLTYQQAIQGAFRDVSDGLVAYQKNREFRIQEEHLYESAGDAARLSQIRFRAGTASYLEVLTNETSAFTAELQLAQARANELIALADLYRALGGGWQ